VTERVRAEERLGEAERRYRTLVEQIPAVTYIDWAVGSDPRCTQPQIEVCSATPRRSDKREAVPRSLHPEDRERVLRRRRASRRREGSASTRSTGLAKDGTVVWVREEGGAGKGREGEPLYAGHFYDLTERREARRPQASEERYRNQSRS
jgi:PAS domain-containing protein